MSSQVINMVSGGNPLNYKIVAGVTAPANPVENTIWVNTAEPMTSFVFDAVEPASPSAGMVWIRTAKSSQVPFNALKRGGVLMIYPTTTFQYVSGAWVRCDAKIYQNGAWSEWCFYVYDNGDEVTATTGGWAQAGVMDSSAGWGNGSVTKNAKSFTINTTNPRGYQFSTSNTIDLSEYSKVYMVVEEETGLAEDGHGPGAWLTVRTSKSGTWNPTTTLSTLPAGTVASQVFSCAGIVEVDVSSLGGSYYLGVAVAGYVTKSVTISAFYLEH